MAKLSDVPGASTFVIIIIIMYYTYFIQIDWIQLILLVLHRTFVISFRPFIHCHRKKMQSTTADNVMLNEHKQLRIYGAFACGALLSFSKWVRKSYELLWIKQHYINRRPLASSNEHQRSSFNLRAGESSTSRWTADIDTIGSAVTWVVVMTDDGDNYILHNSFYETQKYQTNCHRNLSHTIALCISDGRQQQQRHETRCYRNPYL